MNTSGRLSGSTAGRGFPALFLGTVLGVLLQHGGAWADGKLVRKAVPPRQYAGSLEERAQEAILIFHGSNTRGKAVEDLILKVRAEGDVDQFAWVIPFPTRPTVKQEDAELFRELHNYVEARLSNRRTAQEGHAKGEKKDRGAAALEPKPVDVLSRQIVGSYDVAVVRENQAGALNHWLKTEGYQTLEDAEDVIGFYRKKGYVFACIKVANANLGKHKTADLHPLRFTFKTGGRDGIFFPMKMTGLQKDPFDVNLYVFYRFWINDSRSRFGYVHRGFHLRYRDWDTPECETDGGKAYSAPGHDPLLRPLAHRIPSVTRLFQKLHPGETYYLTNIQARALQPGEVRAWSDDLWLFPYYLSSKQVPFDVRENGPASAGWPDEPATEDKQEEDEAGEDVTELESWAWYILAGGAVGLLLLGVWIYRRRREY